jgi:hypothetical protein
MSVLPSVTLCPRRGHDLRESRRDRRVPAGQVALRSLPAHRRPQIADATSVSARRSARTGIRTPMTAFAPTRLQTGT